MNRDARVNAGMREAVEAAMAALDYRPHRAARALRGNRTYALALLAGARDEPLQGGAVPFPEYLGEVIAGCTQTCRPAGFHLVIELLSYGDRRKAAAMAGALLDDLTPDGFDMYNATFVDMWEVIRTAKPETMAAWWAGWKAAGKDTCSALGSLFQNTIDYNTKPQITPIPDVVLNEDETTSFSLHTYITDAECAGDKLQFRMVNAGDVNAGVILDGVPVEEVGRQIFEEVLAVASGKKTKSEEAGVGEEEFAPWSIGPTL